jgi:hypothetical protein
MLWIRLKVPVKKCSFVVVVNYKVNDLLCTINHIVILLYFNCTDVTQD